MRITLGEVTVECGVGDIAAQDDIDVVVNAANAELMPGGGVAGAIHRAAGPELAEACRPLAPIRPGEAVVTDAFGLPNRHVVHCLGPVYGRDEPAAELLASCYRRALDLADDNAVRSIAFPALSAGAFGYPLEDAARVACDAVADRITAGLGHVRLVRFVLFDQRACHVFDEELTRVGAQGQQGDRE
jgi:O-acetyl-ADP-ribose deacetylase